MNKKAFTELFYYKDGILYNKKARGKVLKDSPAGTLNSKGYLQTRINNKMYLNHRIIWILHNYDINSDILIDHKDVNKINNFIDNLRIATYSENNVNKKICTRNKSGVKGVYFDVTLNKWCAQISFNGKRRKSTHTTFEEACNVITVLREKLHGEFSNS